MYLIYLLSTEAASVFSEMLLFFFFLSPNSAAGINEIVVKDQINSLRATSLLEWEEGRIVEEDSDTRNCNLQMSRQ